MQRRAVLEQLLIFNTAGWSPSSSSLQDSQILPEVPVLLVLLVLLFTFHLCFCSGDEQEILPGNFGAALSPMFIASLGKELPVLQDASARRCLFGTAGSTLAFRLFQACCYSLDVSQVCLLHISQLCQCS